MTLQIGAAAPDFELYGKAWGKDAPTYRLSHALKDGGVVLQFFPLPYNGGLRGADVRRARPHRRLP